MRRDLAHIDATLRMLDPTNQPRSVVPTKSRKPRNSIFQRKEILVRVMTILREAESAPITTEAIAARIVADKGLEAVAEFMVTRLATNALKILEKREVVTTDDRGWGITTVGSKRT
jgi:hypothetical protein